MKIPIHKKYGHIYDDRDYLDVNRYFDRVECFEFFSKFILPEEGLYIGENLPFEITNTSTILDTFYRDALLNFFEKNKLYETKTGFDGTLLFAKWVNLANIWFTEKKFDGMICAHYNPRKKKTIIHPGAQRVKIVNWFPLYPQKYVFFNTLGYYSNWMKSFKKLENISDMTRKYNMAIALLVPDHGSLIPYYNLMSDYNIDKESIISRDFIFNRLKDIKIYVENKDIIQKFSFISNYLVDNIKNATTVIHIKDTTSKLFCNIVRSIICAICGKNFSDDSIYIKHINPLIK